MATNPNRKRVAQGAAQGALTGGTAGFMLGGPVGGAIGLGLGAVGGGLLARPGEDEERLRARMRRLQMGVLGEEAAAIENAMLDPVRGAAQEQEVRRRALEQGTATSGAAARRAQAAQRAERQELRRASRQAQMGILELGEDRAREAQRINQALLAADQQRDQNFRQAMFYGGLQAAGQVGSELGTARGERLRQDSALPANAVDLASVADEELLESLPRLSVEELPSIEGVPSAVGGRSGAAGATFEDPLATAQEAFSRTQDPGGLLFGPADEPAVFLQPIDQAPETIFTEGAPGIDQVVMGSPAARAQVDESFSVLKRSGFTNEDARRISTDPGFRRLRAAFPNVSDAQLANASVKFNKLSPEAQDKIFDPRAGGYASIVELAEGL